MECLVILNHELSFQQVSDLCTNYGVDRITTLTPAQKQSWSQIPADCDLPGVAKHLRPILDLIQEFDLVVCQGESTAFIVVYDICRRIGIPLFVATSKRETVETVAADGTATKTAVFKHVQFRNVCSFGHDFYRVRGQCRDCGGSPTSLSFRNRTDAEACFVNQSVVDWYALEKVEDGNVRTLRSWCQTKGVWCRAHQPSGEYCSECQE